MRNEITLDDYWMGRDKTYASELTPEIRENASRLIKVVNELLEELGVTTSVRVSSGWRPSAINSRTPGAASKSYHLTGLAIDLHDPDGELDKLIMDRHTLLNKAGLWHEHPESTPGWCHLDLGTRSARGIRVFRVK